MSTSFRKLFLFLLAGLLWLSVSGQTVCLKVIQTTDVHGTVMQGKFGCVAALIQQERNTAGGPGNTVLADCGDLIQGSFPMTLDHGESIIRALNFLSYDVFVPGNHDFEFGADTFRDHLKNFTGTVCAINLDWENAPVRKWVLLKKNGLDVAVIGIAFPALDTMLYGFQLKSVRLLDVEKEMARIMPEVMNAKPAVIVLAVHSGEYAPLSHNFTLAQLIRKYPQIDLVLGGHSHQEVPGKSIGGHAWFIQAPAHAGGIAVADITYDPQKRRITSLQSRLVFADSGVKPLTEVETLFSELLKRSGQISAEEIARLHFPLEPLAKTENANRLTMLYGNAIQEYTGSKIVFHGTNGNFVQNEGPLKRGQLFALAPYENWIGVLKLTPSECRMILEEQHAKKRSGMFQSPFGILYSTGLGGRIKGPLRLKGEADDWTDENRTVACAFTTFALAGAGGRFPVLRTIATRHAIEFYQESVRTVLENYLRKNYPIQTHKNERKSE